MFRCYCMHSIRLFLPTFWHKRPIVCVQLIAFLLYQPTQQFCNKQINTTVLASVYFVEVLLRVSTLLGHHQAIIT
jgi:hypothetical protein